MLAACGYFLAKPEHNLVLVSLCSFLLCSATYAYNNRFDRKEDEVNYGYVNFFAKNIHGLILILLMFGLGVYLLFYLMQTSFLTGIVIVIIGIIYSVFGLKKITLVKNVYTALGISLLLILGAGVFSYSILQYYFFFSLLVLTGSLISDMKDYRGDKLAGIKTIPVKIGIRKTRVFAYSIIFVLSLLCIWMNMLLPVLLLSIHFLLIYKNSYKKAHTINIFSIVFVILLIIYRM